ncbi:MAG: hypothetical protein CEN88_122 [Candidatus Berkelbacteria bacterium Licking1014_2]|uniref:Uncharacterized protein n=1 Tax=Candidatus Berkelbacteria bacterium Licking1014_2 TaxID=2017146 RepID=A0A554LWG9_9BACT|nr:MAG: hypothetical protein CEN88_122 [Candidatus Berkelbacteria bacterium Licking1014_2]
MSTVLVKKTKEIISQIPQDRLKIAYIFVRWLAEEEFSREDLAAIAKGEKEIKKGLTIPWRDIARTI